MHLDREVYAMAIRAEVVRWLAEGWPLQFVRRVWQSPARDADTPAIARRAIDALARDRIA
jgi:hypothetical protein